MHFYCLFLSAEGDGKSFSILLIYINAIPGKCNALEPKRFPLSPIKRIITNIIAIHFTISLMLILFYFDKESFYSCSFDKKIDLFMVV